MCEQQQALRCSGNDSSGGDSSDNNSDAKRYLWIF
jgi:hypothetical protein